MKRLTVKQKHFVAEYVSNGGNASQAALNTYDCDYQSARVIGSQNLTKVHIRDFIAELMGEHDLKVTDAIKTIKEALTAETERGPNWRVRMKAADMTLRLADAYPTEHSRDIESQVEQRLAKAEQDALVAELSKGPFQVLVFIEEHDRWPTEEEREKLLAEPPRYRSLTE